MCSLFAFNCWDQKKVTQKTKFIGGQVCKCYGLNLISGWFWINLGRFSIVFNSMYWTEEHDKILVREIIANNPFDGTTKKGTPARGAKWNAVMNQLLQIKEPSFKVSLVNIKRTATAMLKRALKVKKISREDLWLCTCLSQLRTFRSRCIQHNAANHQILRS